MSVSGDIPQTASKPDDEDTDAPDEQGAGENGNGKKAMRPLGMNRLRGRMPVLSR